jgi:hypothetical protein
MLRVCARPNLARFISTTVAQNIDALAVALAVATRGLIQILIAANEGRIGHHEDTTRAQAALADAFRNALATKAEERATK